MEIPERVRGLTRYNESFIGAHRLYVAHGLSGAKIRVAADYLYYSGQKTLPFNGDGLL